jgi:hypothetical protein
MSIPRVSRSEQTRLRQLPEGGQLLGSASTTIDTLTEVVEHAIAVLLSHLRVDVVAGVAELGDLLGEQLDALG